MIKKIFKILKENTNEKCQKINFENYLFIKIMKSNNFYSFSNLFCNPDYEGYRNLYYSTCYKKDVLHILVNTDRLDEKFINSFVNYKKFIYDKISGEIYYD